MVERLKPGGAPEAPRPQLIREEDLPAIADSFSKLYALMVPTAVRLIGGKAAAGRDTPLTPDEAEAARVVIELGVRIYRRAILENNAAIVIAVGLSTPVIVRLGMPPPPIATAKAAA